MIDLEQYIYDYVKPIFDSWDELDIYAVSFFASANDLQEYRGFSNVTDLVISYNTERDCPGAGPHSETRWNYAYWRQDETMVFSSFHRTPETAVLFDWYEQEGITNIGYEDSSMEAPVGYKELVDVLSRVARRFQEEGYWVKRFGRPIPILIHDLEYIQCTLDATAYANPNGEAKDFLHGNWGDDSISDDGHQAHDFEKNRDMILKMMADAQARFGSKGFMEQVRNAGLDSYRPNIEAMKQFLYGEDKK